MEEKRGEEMKLTIDLDTVIQEIEVALDHNLSLQYLQFQLTPEGLYWKDVLIDPSIQSENNLTYPVTLNEDGSLEVIRFIELVGKSDYTIRGSIAKIKDSVKKSDVGIGVTDKGVGYGLYQLNQTAIHQGKKPILGAELTSGDAGYFVLAKNRDGYQQLIRMLTEYSAYNQDLPIDKFPETTDLVVIFDPETATDNIQTLIDRVHPNDFYIARHIQDTDSEVMYELSDEHNKPLVLITEYHRVNYEDRDALEAFRKIGSYDDSSPLGKGCYVHTSKEMLDLGVPVEWLDTSIEIYNKIEVYNLKSDEVHYPEFKLPTSFKTEKEYWLYLIDKGIKARLNGVVPDDYRERLDFEIDMIESMGYIGYFLIVADFINYAKRNYTMVDEETTKRWQLFVETHGYDPNPIAIGPARGSVAGSLVAYAMSIIDVDPMKYDLLFERFLNPDRVSLPDIDTDIPDNKRDEIIHYTRDYYNVSDDIVESRVSGIGTFGTFKIKQLLKALVSALYKDTKYGEKLSDLVIDPEMTFGEYINLESVQEEVGDDLRFKRIAKIAPKLMNCIANLTQHAAGYVITPGPVTQFFPTVYVRDKDGKITEQLTAYTDVEALGILKMDYLGLRSMTIIDECIQTVNDHYHTSHTVASILETAITDIEIFRHIASGHTEDIFQLSSSGMTSVITRALGDINQSGAKEKAESGDYFSRIIAGIAMYRPGPMQFIDDFIQNALYPERTHYPLEEMRDVLSSSYGLMIYQESIMALLQRVAGFSLAQADIARRAISKKKLEDLEEQKEIFFHGNGNEIPGGLALGHAEEELEDLWGSVETFAAYGFNKSHAAAYAHIAIITAWLAYYYPAHFAIANLNHPQDKDAVKELIAVYKGRGIQTIPPSVNLSEEVFTTDGESIRFGLSGIKMLASKAGAIFDEREENGLFTDYYNFLSRMARNQTDRSLNKASILGLVYAGALDDFEGSRLSKEEAIDRTTELFSLLKKEPTVIFDKTDTDYFDLYLQTHSAEMNRRELLAREYEYTGFYISGHPTEDYTQLTNSMRDYVPMEDVADVYRGTILGVITRVHKITTKKDNKLMAFVTLEDTTGSVEAIVFPDTYAQDARHLNEGSVVLVHGEVNDEGKMIASSIQNAEERQLHFEIESVHLYLPDDLDISSRILDQIFANEGEETSPLYYYIKGRQYNRSNKYFDAEGKLMDLRITLTYDLIDDIYRQIGPNGLQFVYKTR